RQKLTLPTWRALVERADILGVDERLAALFAGEIVNGTEQRPALHPACRNPALLGESDAAAAMIATRKKTRAFADLMGRPDALDGHPV
ncbi:MAG TPA: glucose-6-phosphate isomerase, partial [Oceanicaulis sp.]|nr:glucose-6-phosphate isomerase [Oceanicaulis sp.]